jgi:hypothetical protein
MQDYTQILTQSASSPTIAGPTLTMRAFLVQEMTDLWGDIPFSEASKGAENLTPKYDSQQVIYDSLFASLTKAATTMNATNVGLLAADPVYGQGTGVTVATQTAKWVKLANSLHARAAMRLSNVDATSRRRSWPRRSAISRRCSRATPTTRSSRIPAVRSPIRSAPTGWVARERATTSASRSASSTRSRSRAIHGSRSTQRRRLASQLATATPCDSTYRGFPNGINEAGKTSLPKNTCTGKTMGLADFSRPTTTIRGQTSPSYIMTYSSCSSSARSGAARLDRRRREGAVRGGHHGVDAAVGRHGAGDRGVSGQAGRGLQPATGLKQIAYEKWVSLFNLENEAYAEWRRLDYPVLVPGPFAKTNTGPTRLPYPAIETSLNGETWRWPARRRPT